MNVRHKAIRITPSEWYLDVLIGKNPTELNRAAKHLFGSELYEDGIGNWVEDVKSKKDSFYKGHIRILLVLESLDPKTVVHELIHVMWHSANKIGYGMTYESQEWQAVLAEHLFSEIMDRKGYSDITQEPLSTDTAE